MSLSNTMLTFSRPLLCAGFLLISQSTLAIELRPIEVITGTTNQKEVPLVVNNQSSKAIECTAQLAHWYSAPLLSVPPGKTGIAQLWLDSTSNVINLLNDKDENMPIEVIWCGFSGKAYETRTLLEIDRTQFGSTANRQFVCRDDESSLRCEPEAS